jgi:endonuclease/exonuclease/phosphatase family metal-dependent hydrolase
MASDEVLIAKERQALMNLMDGKKPFEEFKIPSRRVDETIIVATWNIQQFSNRHTARAIQYIADIVERFDIVALQEVKTDLRGLSRLQRMLPGNYKILVSDPTGNAERFAFLYDKRTVIPTGLVCEIGFNVTAKAHAGYQLHRMPYCASFRAGRFDFVMVSAHIYYGKTKSERLQRKEEIERLAQFVKRRVETDAEKVFDRDFFVVGDFNIEEFGDMFFNALKKGGFKIPPVLRDLKTNYERDHTFDKIVWVPRKSFAFSGKMNVVPFGEVVFKDDDARKRISDHLPLWAEFEVNKLTQALSQIINPGEA